MFFFNLYMESSEKKLILDSHQYNLHTPNIQKQTNKQTKPRATKIKQTRLCIKINFVLK